MPTSPPLLRPGIARFCQCVSCCCAAILTWRRPHTHSSPLRLFLAVDARAWTHWNGTCASLPQARERRLADSLAVLKALCSLIPLSQSSLSPFRLHAGSSRSALAWSSPAGWLKEQTKQKNSEFSNRSFLSDDLPLHLHPDDRYSALLLQLPVLDRGRRYARIAVDPPPPPK
jgi:hypothetical protein